MSKFKDAIKAAKGGDVKKTSNKKSTSKEVKKSSNVEIKKSINVESEKEKMVGINIKVPESHRKHWRIEATKAGSTITSDIIEALTEKYGTP